MKQIILIKIPTPSFHIIKGNSTWCNAKSQRHLEIKGYFHINKNPALQSLILSILMYGSETWTLRKEDENRLLVFEMTCLRKILGVSRLDKIRNTTIRKSLDLKEDIIIQISQKRLRYYGHIMRMKTKRMPYITLNGMVQRDRQRGRPVKRWLDSIRNDVKKTEPDNYRSK